MPPRKAEQIVQVLRNEILSGQRAPGAKLPTYDAFVEQFGVTRPTVARGLKLLRSEGLVTADGTRGVFVAKRLPHHSRYLWVTSEQPGTPGWTSLSAAILELCERGETGLPGEVVPLVGVDGRANNPAYRTLAAAVAQGSAAGLIIAGSSTTQLLPALQAPGLPRVVIGAPQPHAGTLGLDVDALVARAAARLAAAVEKRGRIAVLSPHATHLVRARQTFLKCGVGGRRQALVHVAPVGCETLTELLFERDDRPAAVFIGDDSLVRPFLAGLARAGLSARRDVRVLAHCHWPHPEGTGEGVEYLGFDAREVLAAAKDCIDELRAGHEVVERALPPRFANELLPAQAALASAA